MESGSDFAVEKQRPENQAPESQTPEKRETRRFTLSLDLEKNWKLSGGSGTLRFEVSELWRFLIRGITSFCCMHKHENVVP